MMLEWLRGKPKRPSYTDMMGRVGSIIDHFIELQGLEEFSKKTPLRHHHYGLQSGHFRRTRHMLRIADTARLRLILTVLLVAGAPALAGPNEDILAASQIGDRTAVEAALAGGASVNAGNEMKFTPLAIAAVNDHSNVAALLLTRGANVEITDVLGRTALHHAASNGSTDVARFLLDHGAKVNARDSRRRDSFGVGRLRRSQECC
jgi:hypothetical protein